ncbi:MAG: hypothetical protein BJ554DRAFT_7806 [Olpidium bornovanus]|uniref:Uncharacterized protein n=1 Tax=Olpidium bornovanus TaxID=278681 RepID=A0A8H8A1I1_9FUNG|nr:MAG: hypothetical protein BJ554DRAFT_7806 [Olpidium bornovanus]
MFRAIFTQNRGATVGSSPDDANRDGRESRVYCVDLSQNSQAAVGIHCHGRGDHQPRVERHPVFRVCRPVRALRHHRGRRAPAGRLVPLRRDGRGVLRRARDVPPAVPAAVHFRAQLRRHPPQHGAPPRRAREEPRGPDFGDRARQALRVGEAPRAHRAGPEEQRVQAAPQGLDAQGHERLHFFLLPRCAFVKEIRDAIARWGGKGGGPGRDVEFPLINFFFSSKKPSCLL